MNEKNICRFISVPSSDRLETVYFIYESDSNVMRRPMAYSHHRAILMVTGSGYFCFGEKKTAFCAGDLVFSFSGEYCSVETDEPCEYMYIAFTGGRGEELMRRFSLSSESRVRKGMEGIIPIWREMLSRATDENVDLAAESALLYAFARLDASGVVGEDAVDRMIRMMEENFSDPDLTLTNIAQSLGYNAKYLSHAFRKKCGIGYAEYLKNLRIRHAVVLFGHGIDSVKNVAFLSGFTDPLYFSAVFKKTVGISPKEYREKIAK